MKVIFEHKIRKEGNRSNREKLIKNANFLAFNANFLNVNY